MPELAQTLHAGERCLVVMDAESGLPWEMLGSLRRDLSESRFVVWCTQATPQLVHAALEAGMDGLLSTTLAPRDAAPSLLRICQGEKQFRFDGVAPTHPSAEPGLTPRKQQVVALVMHGHKNREIAAALDTTEGCVKVYLNRIFIKTGAKSRHELAFVGDGTMRRRKTRLRADASPKRAATAFDAGWMFSAGEPDLGPTGEISTHDSPQR